ncbi:uncharacterized protein LOC129222882 [Uloborus diversus]|uniref:uncharacterized protein LOC129222882 n=1 Tax=Uloborus diversus TaxID=327109 RepID=UPI00240A3D00|nr:uncharacterized protein LOC129222882 [Uloborus diversus]XP_054713420.1 uncharacterized protein LOC129222882 [Uloborus diversus]XP_054713421.1 uncharacterized protein LOC129222882 [Uloborus diversus]XP_054713422.1 uncharacterized protein LOC129222882 [Uloborus diversus]
MDGCRDFRGGAPPSPLIPQGPPLIPSTRRHRSRPRSGSSNSNAPWWKAWIKKYVIACLVCGGLSVFHGIVFIVIYLLLRSYTSSLQFFETIPTYVPGVVFIITGLIVMCFAKRRNRYAFLMKMAGGCCLICALLCVVITVTTTVVHMNRLQTLHECVYTPQSKTCMCVSAIGDHNAQEAHRFVFNNTPNCEVVHGSLYSCLRALFSFSVLGILLCISCSMLIYQLLSHEKKRVYWEQLELRRRFLYQRHSHHTVCGCYEELYPWQLWEMLDYRFMNAPGSLPNCGNMEEELCASPNTISLSNRSITSGGGGHRASGWNWLPWPRQQTDRSNPTNGNERSVNDTPTRQNFMRRLMSREGWNQQQLANLNNPMEEVPALEGSVGTLPWRSECIHIFRPNSRTASNCFPPMRFGIRSRNSPYGRPHSNHRRTRSNDGIFHHLHMNPAPRYAQPYSLIDGNGGITCHFSGCEIPRYMWGPPPPYSQPQSTENVALYNENNQNRRTSIGIEQLGGGIEISHCEQVLTALEMERGGNGSVSSKMSTPLSERRYVCHNFSSEGITLTIGGNYGDLCPQDTVHHEHKKEETCIVEVHVPYIFHKKDIVFNTLPARSCRKKDNNPFKSLSNIPLGLSRKINNLKSEKSDPGQLSVIKAFCDDLKKDETVTNNTEADSTKTTSTSQLHTLKEVSRQLFCDGHSVNNSLETDTSPSSLSYQPTMVEIPSEFKSSLVIATSPSTPVAESVPLSNKIYAQSMPNLSLSNSLRQLHRAPSSGNTSTSYDFPDFEFEEDGSPLVLCSPVSDIPSVTLLRDDDESDSSSSYPPCPRIFRCDHDTPFSNDSSSMSCEVTVGNSNSSDSSSCDVIVIGEKRHSNTIHCRSSDTSIVPFTSSPSIIISKRPPTECSINCNIRHLHRYHPEKIEVRPRRLEEAGFNMSQDRTSNFVVTIKSVNV